MILYRNELVLLLKCNMNLLRSLCCVIISNGITLFILNYNALYAIAIYLLDKSPL